MYTILLISILTFVESKIYDSCELAKELVHKHDFAKQDVANWICLVKHESEFNTTAKGGPNGYDNSYDHGLFQINDHYWCAPPEEINECNMRCDDLRNDDITDDVKCVRKIFDIHGFSAWTAWKNHCNGTDLSSYMKDCQI
ncbi:lysozyme C-like [Centruroides vittatus]|uniref:lysozyme C-like n=1 Tax=Centruroides vittatus TaxID=120091 RepID=UPI003510B0D5